MQVTEARHLLSWIVDFVVSSVHERDDTGVSALTAGNERGGSPVREWCVVVLLRACSLVVKSRSSQLPRHCCVRRPDCAGRVTRLQGQAHFELARTASQKKSGFGTFFT
jgi:hypothetical protein